MRDIHRSALGHHIKSVKILTTIDYADFRLSTIDFGDSGALTTITTIATMKKVNDYIDYRLSRLSRLSTFTSATIDYRLSAAAEKTRGRWPPGSVFGCALRSFPRSRGKMLLTVTRDAF